jgi:Tetratricopeptide repeat
MSAAAQHFQAGQLPDAERLLRQVLVTAPRHGPALHLLGVIAYLTERRDLAMDLVKKAVAVSPKDASAHCSLGNLLLQQCRLEEAVTSYRRALRLEPGVAGAVGNLANALFGLRRMDEAQAIYREALTLSPDDPEIHVNLSTLMLARGDMPAGWVEHEWRWKSAHFNRIPRHFTQPQWYGEPAVGKTLLVHAEQGFGDTLHFCRFASQAASRGLRVIVEAPKPLLRLLRSLDGVEKVVLHADALPGFDLHCPMLSLPLALGTTVQTIPNQVPYLRADPHQAATWTSRLTALGTRKPRIGLVWEGGVDKEPQSARAVGRQRSMAPALLAPLFDVPDIQLFSLQKDGTRAPAAFQLHDFMNEMTDFADTAALAENLDLIISIDTSMVHLAGALGKRVWLMDRFLPCWRWMVGGNDNLWYPTLRLYRQRVPGVWISVIAEVARDLRTFAAEWHAVATI